MSLYRATLGLYLGGHCRFSPSCSAYAQQALRQHGLLGGLARAGRQLLRCHPLAAAPAPWRQEEIR